MNRIDTLIRSLFVIAPTALLAACGGAGGADDTSSASASPTQPSTEVAAANENGPDDPVALNDDGVPMNELERDNKAQGTEGEDPGFAETATGAPTPAADESTDGVGQSASALLSSRGSGIKAEAQRIADFVNTATSYYSHTTYMNESTGTRQTDCSGLTGYVLNRTVSNAVAMVPKPSWRAKPLAEDYYAYIASRPTTASTQTTTRWRRITAISSLKPGDMIVWKYPATNPNTGHIMFVRDYPRVGRSDRSEWIIPIIDSTATPHAYKAWDSRGTSETGVGQGAIGLKADANGAPIAYYWTGGTSPTAVYKTVMMARIE